MAKRVRNEDKNNPALPKAGLAAGCIAPPLLCWFEENKRALPFRQQPAPYHIWVSEIMLQQTQVATMLPYYRRFIAALPDVAALAACGEQQLLKLWEGLGYYSRARNLQKAARQVVRQYGGALPADYRQLLALPGIGPYTAGAIASIAFGLPVAAVDGNVLRVMARLLCFDGDVTLPQNKTLLQAETERQMPKDAPGPYNEALMELGALVCTPQNPGCTACPLAALCRGHRAGRAQALPVKKAAPAKKEVPLCVVVVRRGDEVLLHRRAPRGLLAGMWEPLCFEGEGKLSKAGAQARLQALLPGAKLGKALPAASHVFTHRVWRLGGWLCTAPQGAALPGQGTETAGDYVWATPQALKQDYAVPGAFAAYLPYMAGEEV